MDHGDAGALSFTLLGNYANERFGIVNLARTYPHLALDHKEVITTATVTNLLELDAENETDYQFTVQAEDHTVDDPKYGFAHVFAHVCDRNDRTPRFEYPSYEVSVYENIEENILQIRVREISDVPYGHAPNVLILLFLMEAPFKLL